MNVVFDYFQALLNFLGRNLNIITLFLLSFTSYQALKATKAAHQSNELRLLPLLTITFGIADQKVRIKNYGQGVAFDVKIEPWVVFLTDVKIIWELKMKMSETSLIGSNEIKDIELKTFSNGREADLKDIMLAHLKPRSSSNLPKVRIVIWFKNALGNKYFTEIETGRDGVDILTPSKRISIFNNLVLTLRTKGLYLYHLLRFKIHWKLLKFDNIYMKD